MGVSPGQWGLLVAIGACWGSGSGAHPVWARHHQSHGKCSAARGSLLSNAQALCGVLVIIIALKQSTKS